MRIKLLACYSGADFCIRPGEETERFSDAECIRMIANGTAVPVAETRIEMAVAAPREVRPSLAARVKRAVGL